MAGREGEEHVNGLQHSMGFLKQYRDAGHKAELVEVIDTYGLGISPFLVQRALLRHHRWRNDVAP